MALDMAQLVAGAKFRGEFEERMKGVINDVINSKGEVIVRALTVRVVSFNCFAFFLSFCLSVFLSFSLPMLCDTCVPSHPFLPIVFLTGA